MKEVSAYLFSNFSTIILFLHVLSAIVWIGGMIAIRFAVHFSLQMIEEPEIKLQTTLYNLKFFFKLVIPSIIMLIITAIIMTQAVDFKAASLGIFVHMKETIWSIMTILFVAIYSKHSNALHAFKENDLQTVKQHLQPIAQYLIPINIALGLIALFLGIILRGL